MNSRPNMSREGLKMRSIELSNPLLTIAIPTYERAPYLEVCLAQIFKQVNASDRIEVLVSDNASTDSTESVVSNFTNAGKAITYIRNDHNIGSDRNIAQCFEKATGKYVLILGDDDVLLPGAVEKIVTVLADSDFGVLALRPFGYDRDFLKERPPTLFKKAQLFYDVNLFVKKIFVYSTLISANIVNKSAVPELDATQFVGTRLVQTYLILSAAIAKNHNAYIPEYLVACKRNNSGGYNVFEVFSDSFNQALAHFSNRELAATTIRAVNRRLIWFFFPQYIFGVRIQRHRKDITAAIFASLLPTFKTYLSFWICIVPLLKWPRLIALPLAVAVITLARIVKGDFLRLIHFAMAQTVKPRRPDLSP